MSKHDPNDTMICIIGLLFIGVLLLVGNAVWYLVEYRARMTPPTIPCRQGMTLLPGQSCVGTLVIELRPRREKEASY